MSATEASPASLPLLGIFAGGAASRMGGLDKGALQGPVEGRPILLQQVALAESLGLPWVLLGARSTWLERLPRAAQLADEPPGIGPLGALHALLAHATVQGHHQVIGLACDMPYVDTALLQRLCGFPERAAVVAPKDSGSGKWQPLFARYDVARVTPRLLALLGQGERSFQGLFRTLDVSELPLTKSERAKLRDWDEPADIDITQPE